jgi:hypothetical protein
MWGVVGVFALFGYRYNAFILIRGVIIVLGVSLVVRAFTPRR